MNRWLVHKLLATLVLAAPLLSISPAPAQASSLGCTFEPGSGASYACLAISGSGLYVNGFRVARNNQATSICNYKAKVVVTAPSGTRWVYRSPYHAGCSWNTAWMDMAVYRSFPNNSRACGHWYEMGHWLPGVPCNTIHR